MVKPSGSENTKFSDTDTCIIISRENVNTFLSVETDQDGKVSKTINNKAFKKIFKPLMETARFDIRRTHEMQTFKMSCSIGTRTVPTTNKDGFRHLYNCGKCHRPFLLEGLLNNFENDELIVNLKYKPEHPNSCEETLVVEQSTLSSNRVIRSPIPSPVKQQEEYEKSEKIEAKKLFKNLPLNWDAEEIEKEGENLLAIDPEMIFIKQISHIPYIITIMNVKSVETMINWCDSKSIKLHFKDKLLPFQSKDSKNLRYGSIFMEFEDETDSLLEICSTIYNPKTFGNFVSQSSMLLSAFKNYTSTYSKDWPFMKGVIFVFPSIELLSRITQDLLDMKFESYLDNVCFGSEELKLQLKIRNNDLQELLMHDLNRFEENQERRTLILKAVLLMSIESDLNVVETQISQLLEFLLSKTLNETFEQQIDLIQENFNKSGLKIVNHNRIDNVSAISLFNQNELNKMVSDTKLFNRISELKSHVEAKIMSQQNLMDDNDNHYYNIDLADFLVAQYFMLIPLWNDTNLFDYREELFEDYHQKINHSPENNKSSLINFIEAKIVVDNTILSECQKFVKKGNQSKIKIYKESWGETTKPFIDKIKSVNEYQSTHTSISFAKVDKKKSQGLELVDVTHDSFVEETFENEDFVFEEQEVQEYFWSTEYLQPEVSENEGKEIVDDSEEVKETGEGKEKQINESDDLKIHVIISEDSGEGHEGEANESDKQRMDATINSENFEEPESAFWNTEYLQTEVSENEGNEIVDYSEVKDTGEGKEKQINESDDLKIHVIISEDSGEGHEGEANESDKQRSDATIDPENFEEPESAKTTKIEDVHPQILENQLILDSNYYANFDDIQTVAVLKINKKEFNVTAKIFKMIAKNEMDFHMLDVIAKKYLIFKKLPTIQFVDSNTQFKITYKRKNVEHIISAEELNGVLILFNYEVKAKTLQSVIGGNYSDIQNELKLTEDKLVSNLKKLDFNVLKKKQEITEINNKNELLCYFVKICSEENINTGNILEFILTSSEDMENNCLICSVHNKKTKAGVIWTGCDLCSRWWHKNCDPMENVCKYCVGYYNLS